MCDGYDSSTKDDSSNLEDELLCEYVDGTMDPLVREVFEEYLGANPDVREHVECLRSTRLLLCRYGCRCRAPHDLHDRLRRQITCDLVSGKVPFHILVADRLKGATVTSAMALLIVFGAVGGFSVMQDGELSSSVVSAAVVTVHENDVDRPRDVVDMTAKPLLSPRVSSFGPVPAVRSFVSSHAGLHAFQQPDSSGARQLERSRLLP